MLQGVRRLCFFFTHVICCLTQFTACVTLTKAAAGFPCPQKGQFAGQAEVYVFCRKFFCQSVYCVFFQKGSQPD